MSLHVATGDSCTVGYANTGGTKMCNMTACNPITHSCGPELDSQNAAISWGALTAQHFAADYQVIAWSGAGLVTYAHSKELTAEQPDVPLSVAQNVYPTDVELFSRQVAADNSTTVSNYSTWVPQVTQCIAVCCAKRVLVCHHAAPRGTRHASPA